jgi:UDP-GlcNAc:undecaprenyl-phosphate GlcNAc-1-phosphate transferase
MISFFVFFSISAILVFLLSRLALGAPSHKASQLQDTHKNTSSRLGGVGLVISIVVFVIYGVLEGLVEISDTVFPLVGAILLFILGLVDDLVNHIRPIIRFTIIFLVSVAISYFGTPLYRIDVGVIDSLFRSSLFFSVIITSFALSGITISINMIDGINGLAAATSSLCLLALSMIAIHNGELELARLVLYIVTCVLGFLVVNVSRGNIFLGDSGAYFLGFLCAALCVIENNSFANVSSWAFLLICIYPFNETLLSIIRRYFGNANIAYPDQRHLHHLVLEYLKVRYFYDEQKDTLNHFLAAALCLILPLVSCSLAIFFQEDTSLLVCFCIGIFVLQLGVYCLLRNVLKNPQLT